MSPEPDPPNEASRLEKVFQRRDQSSAPCPWQHPWWALRAMEETLVLNRLLFQSLGSEPGACQILDVGCGYGGFLRRMLDLGIPAENLWGTELLDNRLETARSLSPPGIHWYRGWPDGMPEGIDFDLVTAFTVFSSILQDGLREELASQMWRRLRPGGEMIVYDFRYDNPANPDVRGVRPRQVFGSLTRTANTHSVLLAPPVGRWLARIHPLLYHLTTTLAPFLRTHFFWHGRKP